jgi:tetratricopeptide (TPR) repeat protein
MTKMQSTGTTVPVATGTWDSKFFDSYRGRMDRAIEDFDKAIELDQANSIIYSNRGLVNRKLE